MSMPKRSLTIVNKFFLTPTLIIICGLSQIISAQGEPQNKWQDYINEAWGGNFRPFMEVSVGYGIPAQRNFESDFSKDMGAGFIIGYSSIERFKRFIPKLDERFLYGSYLSTDLNIFNPDSKISSELERDPNRTDTTGNVYSKIATFGFGYRDGFGYALEPLVEIIPYNQVTISFTQFDFTPQDSLSQNDIAILERYNKAWRLGQTYSGGLKFQIFKSLAATGSYDLAVTYPRLVFWEWFGSFLIQYGVTSAMTVYSEEIVNNAPLVGPLMYFALKNGLSFLFFRAMSYNMNWPFKSETPLTSVTIRLGASITF